MLYDSLVSRNSNDSSNTSGPLHADKQSDTRFNFLNFLFTNARSLAPKVESLVEMFDNLEIDFAAVSETWLMGGKRFRKNVQKLEDRDDLVMIFKNRKSRGGGVAIIFDKKRMNLKPVDMKQGDLEVVGAVGRTVNDSTKIFVVSAYYPPQTRKEGVDALNSCIARAVEQMKNQHEGLKIVICGDMNKKDIVPILLDHPDILVMQSPSTRKAETIDLCLTNIELHNAVIRKYPPLTTPDGKRSDHDCIMCSTKVPKKHIFKKTTFKFRPYSKEYSAAFGAQLAQVDWAFLHYMEVDEAVHTFDHTIKTIYENTFPEKSKTVKSSDAPWMNKNIRRLVERKRKYYKKHGKSDRWRTIEEKTQHEIYLGKKSYVRKAKSHMMSTKNSGAFFKMVNCLKTKEKPKPWNVMQLFPGEDAQTVADRCVDFFSEISNEYPSLPEPAPPAHGSDWELLLHEVALKLRHCKKPKSKVEGDIEPKLVTDHADLLAVPLLCIYNKILSSWQWPIKWKTETVKIIPKKSIPSSLKDVRNISCTPLFSKVLEQFVLTRLRGEMSLSANQFGGLKGVAIDHFLCETWHEILDHLEDSEAATSLISVDFSKAFNRMNHFACLDALRNAGASETTVGAVHAFLYDRRMRVHVHNTVSKTMKAPGGAPQGSVLGSFLFCATTEPLNAAASVNELNNTASFNNNGIDTSASDSDGGGGSVSPIAVPFRPVSPPNIGQLDVSISDEEDVINFGIRKAGQRLMDSTIESIAPSQTLLENVLELREWKRVKPSVKAYIDDYNVIEKVRTTGAISHFTQGKATYEVHAPQSQHIFANVKSVAADIGMIVNDDKTQLLCIHPSGPTYKSYIRADESGGRILSGGKLKILGFTFGQKPDVDVHTEALISSFNSKLWSMRHLRRSGMESGDLLDIYKSTIRPSIDFAANTYHSLLTKQQSSDIERLQLKATKIALGEKVSYNTVIDSGLIETLYSRREQAFRKFAIKTSKNPRFQHWFPLNEEIPHNLRRREKYFIPKSKTERGMKSPILNMRRILNQLNQ